MRVVFGIRTATAAAPTVGVVLTAFVGLTKDGARSIAASDAVRGEGTASALQALIAAMRRIFEITADSMKQYDDHALILLANHVNSLTEESFTARLTPFVAAYSDQIDPIGRRAGDDAPWGAKGRMQKAVKVSLGNGARTALVCVDGDADVLGRFHEFYHFARWIDPEMEVFARNAKIVDVGLVRDLPLVDLMPTPDVP